jgi:hypothetical protein
MSAGEIAIFAMHKRTSAAAATVSPPWLGKPTCQYASAKSRESVNGAITNPGAVAVANPRGAYAPRSCVGVGMSAGEIAIFAMHKRTSAGAATVSPPWFGNRAGNGDRFSSSDYVHHVLSDGAPRLLTPAAPGAALGGRTPIVANMRLRFARANRFTATAGLRQPLLVREAGPLKNNDIRGAQTHVLQERRA